MTEFTDDAGQSIRLSDERLDHIERRPEMQNQLDRLEETLAKPDVVRESDQDSTVHLYYREYASTPVSEKYLVAIVKIDSASPFVITAFFTDRIQTGSTIE